MTLPAGGDNDAMFRNWIRHHPDAPAHLRRAFMYMERGLVPQLPADASAQPAQGNAPTDDCDSDDDTKYMRFKEMFF